MSKWIGVGGVWKPVSQGGGFQIGVGAAWKVVQQAWIGISGVWKQYFINAVFALPSSATDVNVVGGGAACHVSFSNTGTYSAVGDNVGLTEFGNWVTPTSVAPGAYTIRAHVNSGGTPTGSALDTDIPLSSAAQWNLSCPGASSNSCDLLLTIKDGGGNVMLSQVCPMSVSSV